MCSKNMKLSKSPDIKISQNRKVSKCVFIKMKLSKSPDIKISQNRRSQKCVFIKMKLLKIPNVKNVCSKNETIKKSWYENFSTQKVSKMCVQKINKYLMRDVTVRCVKIYTTNPKSWYQNSLHRRSKKCLFKKMKLSKSPDIKISLYRRYQKRVFKNWNYQIVLI